MTAALGIASTGILLVPSCKKDCKTSQCFDRKTMLTDIGNNVILPAFEEFAAKAQALEEQSVTFANTPNINELITLQNRWKETAYAIKKIELFKVGPVNDNFAYANIDFWPVRTNDVNNYFNNATTITAADLSTKGSTVKGSPVIEYLIFAHAGGNIAVLDRFNTDADAAKRKDYLKALCTNLNGTAQMLNNAWKNNYLQTFLAADGTDINSSCNSLVNELLATEDYVKGMKVGYPAGKKDGTLYPENVEAYQSGESIHFIENNLTIFETTFTGGTGQGLDDYLNFVGAESDGVLLSKKIIDQFAVCQSKCGAINLPLSDAVTQQPDKVTELYNELQKLLVYLKVDMVNNLGITITFNDNDGD